MHKISDEIKKYYLKNPHKFEERKFLSFQNLEEYLEEYNLDYLKKAVFQKWERIWLNAQSYWIFPDDEDMKKIINNEYEIYKGDNAMEIDIKK